MGMAAELSFLSEIGAIIVAAAVSSYLLNALRQPPLLGYLVAGVALGIAGFAAASAELQALSELGVAFLLFGAAVEVDLLKLRGIGVQSVLAVLIQVPLTLLAGYLASLALGLPPAQATLLGVILSFSSTMVVVKVLQDTHRTFTLHARLEIALMILQDVLAIVALAFLSSSLGGAPSFAAPLVGGLGLFCIAVVLNRFVFPSLMRSASRSTEVLFLSSVAICFSFMWLAASLGMPLAIGAFVAGISLSTFPYNLEVSGKVRSLRDFFAAIFFVSLGMQAIPALGADSLALAAFLISFTLIGKTAITTFTFLLLGFGPRVSLLAALGTAQISEFSFIIALLALQAGALPPSVFSAVAVATVATIALTPYLAMSEYAVYEFLHRLLSPLRGVPLFSLRAPRELFSEAPSFENHVVIVGAHRMGRVLVEELKGENLLVVDYSPAVLDELIEEGVKCMYADAYSDDTVTRLHLRKAKALISTIPDPQVALSLVRRAKEINPKLRVYVKADFAEDAQALTEAGADLAVVPDLLAGESFAQSIRKLLAHPIMLSGMKKRQEKLLQLQSNFGEENKKEGDVR